MKTIFRTLCCMSVAAIFAACSSDKASYVKPGGPQSVITTKKINIADWNNAASALVNDMLASGCLEKFKQPVRMKVSRIINRTSESIDTDMLTKQICIVLNNSGKAIAVSDDKATKELADYQAFMAGTKTPVPAITMTGKIIEDRDDNEDVREVTYIFMLDINSGGAAIWSGQKQISKQSPKGLFD